MATKKEKYCGEFLQAGAFIGNVYKTDAGYIVREIKEYARKPGQVLFDGRVFSGKDFKHLSTLNLGYATLRSYTFSSAA